MIRLRLRRTGARKKPSYRLVVVDSRAPRDGAFIEMVGQYDPRTEPAKVVFDKERVSKWLGQGAQPSATVARLLRRAGLSADQAPAPVAAPALVEPVKRRRRRSPEAKASIETAGETD